MADTANARMDTNLFRPTSRYIGMRQANAVQAQMDTPQDLPTLRNEIQALEAKAKTRRFRKPLSTRLFAYHVS
jgi:hypothetical protein